MITIDSEVSFADPMSCLPDPSRDPAVHLLQRRVDLQEYIDGLDRGGLDPQNGVVDRNFRAGEPEILPAHCSEIASGQQQMTMLSFMSSRGGHLM